MVHALGDSNTATQVATQVARNSNSESFLFKINTFWRKYGNVIMIAVLVSFMYIHGTQSYTSFSTPASQPPITIRSNDDTSGGASNGGASNGGASNGGASNGGTSNYCTMTSVNGDVSCTPPGCATYCPETTQAYTNHQVSVSCHKTTVGSTTTCNPARCTLGCPGYELSPGEGIRQTRAHAAWLRAQYGMETSDHRNTPSTVQPLSDIEYENRRERTRNSGRRLCRDGVTAYYCSFLESCGRGSCIPQNRIRCDDKPDGSTYDCRMGQTCGGGNCVPFGKKLCTTDNKDRFCDGLHSCCRGANPTNSQVSCFPGSSCPSGTVQVMEYIHPEYYHAGEQ